MKRLKLLAGGAAFVIASAVGLAAVPAGATTSSCNLGEFPVSEASTSNLRVSCVVGTGDGSDAVQITDFDNTAWHDGAARHVTVNNPTANGTVLNVTGAHDHVNIAGTFSTGTFGSQTGDENRVVEAGFGKLTPGSFIVNETGTGSGGTITLNQPVVKTGNYTLLIEDGPGRAVKDASYANGSTTLTSATANFVDGSGISSDVGKSIGGTGIPEGDTIAAVNSATNVTLAHATTAASGGAVGTISIADTTRNATHRLVNDLAVQTSHVFSAMANFQQTDVGLNIVGTGLPANAYILSVQDAQNATLSASATTPAANIVAQIGTPSATAPLKDGVDPIVNLETEIQLDPGLVAGSPSCADDIITGTNIQGVWNSPAKFATKRLATDPIFYFNDTHIGLSDPKERAQTMLASGPFIGQIQFKTSVIQFAAYVQETTGGSVTISAPFVPTGLGQCSGTSIADTFDFSGSVLSQATAPSGYGKPGSASFRVTPELNFAGTTSTGTASYDNWHADSVTLSGATMNLTSNNLTSAGNSLIDGQVVTVDCGAHCVAEGLKINTPYYVKVITAGSVFQLDAKPWLPGGTAPVVVPFVAVDIKSSSFTADVFYNTFTHVFGPQTDTCSIVRNITMANFASTFPCQAG